MAEGCEESRDAESEHKLNINDGNKWWGNIKWVKMFRLWIYWSSYEISRGICFYHHKWLLNFKLLLNYQPRPFNHPNSYPYYIINNSKILTYCSIYIYLYSFHQSTYCCFYKLFLCALNYLLNLNSSSSLLALSLCSGLKFTNYNSKLVGKGFLRV